MCVLHGVFKKIDQNLFNQNGVHGDEHHFLRYHNVNFLRRIALFEFQYDGIDKFFKYGRRFDDSDSAVVDSGNGEQIFHHAYQPFRILLDPLNNPAFTAFGKRCTVFEQCRAGSIDRSQRRPQIMRHCPQQICSHTFLIALCLDRFLPL